MSLRLSLALFVTLSAPLAAEPALPLPVMSKPVGDSGWLGFSLLPKAFQRNPQLEMTVISEVTEHGRSLPAPSPDRPVYYLGHNTGYSARGDVMGDRPPPANYVGEVLQRALITNGFLPADATHPPMQVLVFHWGSHNAMDVELRRMFPELNRRHVLERSQLVGGARFQLSISRRFSFGDFPTDHTADNDFLTYQAHDSLYFGIVSAYDAAALVKGQRQLLWRTKLTVNSRGVSMVDSLPALILSGSTSFGRDMTKPEIVLRRVRRGVVELGEPTIVETNAALPAPAKSD